MTVLESVQRAMMRAIALGPEYAPLEMFEGNHARIIKGLSIHANTISHARLIALEETFPRTRRLLGEAEFNQISRQFIETRAGRETLAILGELFPAWIAAKSELKVAVDLARFEWAWLQSYNSENAPALTLPTLAELKADAIVNLVIARHPASIALELDVNAREQIEFETGDPLPFERILLVRPQAEVRIVPASPDALQIYDALLEPTPISNILRQSPVSDVQQPLLALVAAGALLEAEREPQ